MPHFKPTPNSFPQARKALLLKTIPVSLIAGMGGFLIGFYKADWDEVAGIYLPLILLFVIGINLLVTYFVANKRRAIYESYLLTIDEVNITREQLNTPPLAIPKSEVRNITKNRSGNIFIQGRAKLDVIHVPSQIAGIANLEALLADVQPITTGMHASRIQLYRRGLSLLSIGLMAVVYLSENKMFVAISGIALMGSMGYSYYQYYISKNVDYRSKNLVWWVVLVMVSIGAIVCIKVFGVE
jgi:hypothetical protein